MKAHFFDEPELEFGGGRHIDIRFGLSTYGAIDSANNLAPKSVRLGVVGAHASIDRFREWVDQCRSGVEAKKTKLTTLFPEFLGFGDGGPFCDIVCDDQLMRAISTRQFKSLASLESRDELVRNSVDRYVEVLDDLFENSAADVGVCLMAPELMKRVDITGPETKGPRSRKNGAANRLHQIVWHDYLKARAMRLSRPVQVARPATYGGIVQRYRQDGTASKDVEDEASRAWNFFTALYYKAGGVPWRLLRQSSDFDTCYVGISFFHEITGDAVQTSVAQVFNERGEGVVVRGGQAQVSKEDRTLHLDEASSCSLLVRALALYKREHGHLPARAVCHKSSYFTEAEISGFRSGAEQSGIDQMDLLSLRKSFTRFFRRKPHPPLRGTAIEMGPDQALLYTQGSVDFYRAYPGLYVPRPLEVRFDSVDRSPNHLLPEILALTKMNWNSTRFVNAEPITLAAARNVGDILRYLSPSDEIRERYSHYM